MTTQLGGRGIDPAVSGGPRHGASDAGPDEQVRSFTFRLVVGGAMLTAILPAVGGEDFLLVRDSLPSSVNPAFLVFGAPLADGSVVREAASIQQMDGTVSDVQIVRATSLSTVLAREPAWDAAAGALVVLPLLYWWWRRSAPSFGRLLGLAVAGIAGAVIVSLTWSSQSCAASRLVVVPAVHAAAFLLAPAPRDPDAVDDAETWWLMRRRRRTPRQGPAAPGAAG